MSTVERINILGAEQELENKVTFKDIVNTLRLYFKKVELQVKVEAIAFQILSLEVKVRTGIIRELTFSSGNTKMGRILNVNFPVGITCRPDAPCKKGCYATNGNFKFINTVLAYWRNYYVWKYWPERAAEQLSFALGGVRFFRCFASGDIPDYKFLDAVMKAAERNPKCDVWVPTKKYELVNAWMDRHNGNMPKNVHVMFSKWKDWEPENPYGFAVSEVDFCDGTEHSGFRCPGHCSECHHCFEMERGETIIYKKH